MPQQATDEELEEGLSIADKILAALQAGGGALRGISEGTLGEGEVPSGGDFVRAGEDTDESPQGFMQQLQRLGRIQSKGRVAQFNQQEASAESTADRILKLSQAASQQSLAENRGAKLDFARGRFEIENLNSIEDLERKREELRLQRDEFRAANDPESVENALALEKVINGRITALASQQDAQSRADRVPSQNLEDEGQGALAQARAKDVSAGRATANRFAKVQEDLVGLKRIMDQSIAALNKAKEAGELSVPLNEFFENLKNLSIAAENFGDADFETDPGLIRRGIEAIGGPDAQTGIEKGVSGALQSGVESLVPPPPQVGDLGEAPDEVIDELLLKHGQDVEKAKAEARQLGYTVP